MTTASDDFVTSLAVLGLGVEWEWKNGSWWKTPAAMNVRATAALMVAQKARFVAITAMERPDKEVRLDYQWDFKGQLLTFTTVTAAQHIATIADICPAADWVERETHEYFAVEFIGRETTKPLMTRAGDPIGINLHKETAQ
jgi:hypothetical protein